MKHYDFPIIIEQDNDGYFATCPELQGCYSQGNTYEEVVFNIKDAINLHLQDKIAEKEEIPTTKSISLSTVHVTL
ncbi:MAG: type II toxin-antitoxin system HicB family antitoxin [Candidatus Yanofskybacteria bacterium]|nr:type II toxin-antitoxin system HicB family antitoxin [Candidatus Yanofskybacteria bacterium]